MKRFSAILLILFTTAVFAPAYAEISDDFWDEPMKIDNAAKSQQKAVTDQEFEKVMQMFEKKKKKREEKNKPKGNPVWQNNTDPDSQNSISGVLKNMKDDYPTLMIPVTLITPEQTEITPGYYRVLSAKNDSGYFINLYQGNSLIAKVPAVNTGNDHNQKSLNYAKVIPVDDTLMNLIYGDIDCNIEAVVRIKQ